MMKHLLFWGLVCLGAGAAPTARGQGAPGAAPAPDHVLMRDGKMLVVRGGQMQPMPAAMPLQNGTTVRPDGKLTMPNGQWMPLQNGEQVGLNGRITPAPQPRQRRVTRFNKHVDAGMLQSGR